MWFAMGRQIACLASAEGTYCIVLCVWKFSNFSGKKVPGNGFGLRVPSDSRITKYTRTTISGLQFSPKSRFRCCFAVLTLCWRDVVARCEQTITLDFSIAYNKASASPASYFPLDAKCNMAMWCSILPILPLYSQFPSKTDKVGVIVFTCENLDKHLSAGVRRYMATSRGGGGGGVGAHASVLYLLLCTVHLPCYQIHTSVLKFLFVRQLNCPSGGGALIWAV